MERTHRRADLDRTIFACEALVALATTIVAVSIARAILRAGLATAIDSCEPTIADTCKVRGACTLPTALIRTLGNTNGTIIPTVSRKTFTDAPFLARSLEGARVWTHGDGAIFASKTRAAVAFAVLLACTFARTVI